MNINDLLASSEGKTLEFKRDLSSPKPVLRALVAFANTAGSTLIVGRADDGNIVLSVNTLYSLTRFGVLYNANY